MDGPLGIASVGPYPSRLEHDRCRVGIVDPYKNQRVRRQIRIEWKIDDY